MNYLIIGSIYKNRTRANSICIYNICEELIKRGHSVWCISTSNKNQYEEFINNGIHEYGIKKSLHEHILNVLENKKNFFLKIIYKIFIVFRWMVVLPNFPNVSKNRSKKVFKLANQLIKNKNINVVLGVYKPYEGIWVAIQLKKKYKTKLNVITYHLDLMTSPYNSNRLIQQYKIQQNNKKILYELQYVDKMLLPDTGKGLYDNDKITYVDFPMYKIETVFVPNKFRYISKYINITYVGSLDILNRNMEYILKIIEKSAIKFIIVHIWGHLDNESMKIIQKNFKIVQYHGVVNSENVSYLLKNCDFILNISNKLTYRMLPSKIFQYMSMHKPIINVVNNALDYSLRYFELYGEYALNIMEYKSDVNQDVIRFKKFINDYNKKDIQINDKLFIKSTPEYICDCIQN